MVIPAKNGGPIIPAKSALTLARSADQLHHERIAPQPPRVRIGPPQVQPPPHRTIRARASLNNLGR